jgi:hypothetical protein
MNTNEGAEPLEAEIARMEQVCSALRISSILNSERSMTSAENDVLEEHLQTVSIARTCNIVRFLRSRRNVEWSKLSDSDILTTLSGDLSQLIMHVDSAVAQAISANLGVILRSPESFGRKVLAFLLKSENAINISAFASSTFPAFFSNFASLEYVSNGASVILELINSPRGLAIAEEFMRPFLWSMCPFYDNLWYNFAEAVAELPTLPKELYFRALQYALTIAISLIEPPYREVLRSYCLVDPVAKRPPFVLDIVIYKSAKLFFRHSPLFFPLRDLCEKILVAFKLLTQHNCPLPESDTILAILLVNKPTVFSTPTLFDSAGMGHLPMLVTLYDVNNYCHCLLPDNQYDLLFSQDERDLAKLPRNILRALTMQSYDNRRHFGHSEECPIIPIAPFTFEHKFFADSECAEYESQWNRCHGNWQCLLAIFPRNFRLFVLYKEAQEMTEKVLRMNSVFGLISQRIVMSDYQKSLERYQYLVLSSFFAKSVKSFRIDSRKPAHSVIDGLTFLWKVTHFAPQFVKPFLVQLLNRLQSVFGHAKLAGIKKAFEKILTKRAASPPAEFTVVMASRIYKESLRCLVYRKLPPLGHRFMLLLDFLDKADLVQKTFFPQNHRKLIHIIALCFAASKNSSLLETLLFIDRIFFHTHFSDVFDAGLKEKWCFLTQGLWYLVADDPELAGECRDLPFL